MKRKNKAILKVTVSLLFIGMLSTFANAYGGASGQPSFESLDSDGDGKIFFSEFMDNMPSGMRASPEDVFTRLDGNGDGSISREEFDSRLSRPTGRPSGMSDHP